jgi:phosphoenolpyruvate carboxykinase (GTP)
MADYFKHWLEARQNHDASKLPVIYSVNWFRKDTEGKFLWPGYGDNSRVLKWVFENLDGADNAVKTPIGHLPRPEALDVTDLNLAEDALEQLLTVDVAAWKREARSIRQFYQTFGTRLPQVLSDELDALQERLTLSEFQGKIH